VSHSLTDTYEASAPIRASKADSARAIFLRNRPATLGLIAIILLIAACFLEPMLVPYSPLFINLHQRFQAPFLGPHLLGTDQLGRDMLARLLAAGRISLAVGFFAMAISMVVGTTIGLIAGFYRGLVGAVLMRIVDAVLCFPSIFLLLTLAALIDQSIITITLIIAFSSWMEVARVVYSQVLTLRERDFALAAEAIGVSDAMIMLRELLPNMMAPIIVAATLNVARAILMESYMSYLGYGVEPPTPSWGNMLTNAQEYLEAAPWLALLPGGAITLAVTSFNFIGDGLRDALDPLRDRSA
jgi:peptide/nickel transport system permease protein